MQMCRIDTDFDLRSAESNVQCLLVDLRGLAELGEEFFEPAVESRSFLAGRIATRKLQDVVDDRADPFAVAA